jgi:deoxyribodipyrimidine photo-lyase
MIQEERVHALNRKIVSSGRYVLYWMQASQRAEYNYALEYGISQANALSQPLVVYFGLTDAFPEANERHYRFMIEGLREVKRSLAARGILMIIRHESPETGALRLSGEASLIVVDRGYLRIQRKWREYLAERCDCPVVQIESDVVVPVQTASPKEEYSAATFRPKIARQLPRFLVPLEEEQPKISSLALGMESLGVESTDEVMAGLSIDRNVRPVDGYHGGTLEAKRHLEEFLESNLDKYPALRNDPNEDCASKIRPYLHFGNLSPVYVGLRAKEIGGPASDKFLEELIVRRELSINFVFYNESYDSYSGLPLWSRNTLLEHLKDAREYTYTLEEQEAGRTHDPYWNAAQRQMTTSGKMHGYMRMYWGKKIIEWSSTPQDAYRNALYLNNKYELDGRDPNGFTGVAWCFGKHDRPWPKSAVFGNLRHMTAKGLTRKFDAERYARQFQR